MSAFVLSRGYDLQLPNSYVEIERDEMEYVDGGWSAYKVGVNLLRIGAAAWGGYLLVQAGNIMLQAARAGISFWGAVAKVGYAAKQAFILLPLWAKVAVGVGTSATIWALGTYDF